MKSNLSIRQLKSLEKGKNLVRPRKELRIHVSTAYKIFDKFDITSKDKYLIRTILQDVVDAIQENCNEENLPTSEELAMSLLAIVPEVKRQYQYSKAKSVAHRVHVKGLMAHRLRLFRFERPCCNKIPGIWPLCKTPCKCTPRCN